MPDPTTLIVTPAPPVQAGDSITVRLRWRLRVPASLGRTQTG
jgi:hypothetical protein